MKRRGDRNKKPDNTKGRSEGGKGNFRSDEDVEKDGGGQEGIRVRRGGRRDKVSGGEEEKLKAEDEAAGEEERSKKRY